MAQVLGVVSRLTANGNLAVSTMSAYSLAFRECRLTKIHMSDHINAIYELSSLSPTKTEAHAKLSLHMGSPQHVESHGQFHPPQPQACITSRWVSSLAVTTFGAGQLQAHHREVARCKRVQSSNCALSKPAGGAPSGLWTQQTQVSSEIHPGLLS